MKAFLRLLFRLLFRFRVINAEVLSAPGPLLLLPNHVSWIDWLLLWAWAPLGWRAVVSKRTAQTSGLHRRIMLHDGTFPVDFDSPYAMKHIAAFLRSGGKLLLFPEGRLSRTGSLMRLFGGTGFLLTKTKAKVVLCHFRGADRLPASPNPNRKRWFPRVTAHLSKVMEVPEFAGERSAMQRAAANAWLRDQMVSFRFAVEMEHGAGDLAEAMTDAAALHGKATALEDMNGTMSRERLVLGARLFAEQLTAVLDQGHPRVGVLLPNVNAAPVVLLALWALGKEAALLNFSSGPAQMLACAQSAGLRDLVTSRAFLAKARIDLGMLETAGIRLVYLEDLRDRISAADKLKAKLSTMTGGGLGPLARNAWDGLSREERGSRTAVILFTSGSEGVPKGVQLSHRNILANVRQMLAVTDLTDADKLFNAMPLFHSFGLTVGCVLPLLSGMSVYLYPSPLHYRIIPSAVYECDATLMIATNTFLNGYARKAHPYDFRSVRCLFVAAEKLQEDTARIWAQRFGIRVLEGYGATECSPSVTLNTGPAPKFGSAGRLLPGMEMRMDPVEGVAEGGRLFVRGPNVMKGYLSDSQELLNDPQRWYDTGDVVRVDDEGFVFIQGRMKRFAKVGGEMISLTAVEDAMAAAFADFGPRCEVAILTVQDRDRGEQLCAVTTDPRVTTDAMRQAIRDHGLPNLAVPRYIRTVPEIPRLGTGKVNYRELERQISLPD